MRTISDTISRFAASREAAGRAPRFAGAARLKTLDGFGSNPGALGARTYVPARLADRPALVVVLHGCTQSAEGYDAGSGWSQLADRYGFALLFAEQQRGNNANLCFNWFSPEDSRRGGGEALSIRQMIAAIVAQHRIDPARIFVTGLSAGGAMAAVMLATYPELFAGGAIIAGLPFGCAGTVPEAFDRMRGHGLPRETALAALARNAAGHRGPWPTLSIWHGTADTTVDPANADAILDQWRALHGVGRAPSRVETVAGHPRRVWCDAGGREVIEDYRIAGMGHGTPLRTAGPDGCGASGAFMLEANISSTRRICDFWGLSDDVTAPAQGAADGRELVAHAGEVADMRSASPAAPTIDRPAGIARIIEDALRSAGLMRDEP